MRKILSVLLVLILVLTPLSINAAPSSSFINTTPTGYDSADDVRYVTANVSGRTVVTNWGARGETCVFLTKYVSGYYTDSYNTMASWTGGTGTGNVTNSQMFLELRELMTSSHVFYTYYDGNKNVRNFYKYTDCVSNDTSKVALIYRGTMVSSAWDGGSTWNQEHVWPQSKLNGSKQIGDIMHLRPSNPSENSSRGNKPYGTKSGNYDPGVSVRGDCARMALYMYVRWGNSFSDIFESVDLMLQWMKEDPVDTWEMARNDSVQSITGVRNVFVDYPELAFLMFSKSVPKDMTTPSGNAKNGTSTPAPCQHTSTEVRNYKAASCTTTGYSGDTYCKSCGTKTATGSTIKAIGHKDTDNDGRCNACNFLMNCNHTNTELRNQKPGSCAQAGCTGDTYCKDCGIQLQTGNTIGGKGHLDLDGNGECDSCGNRSNCAHNNVSTKNMTPSSCTEHGYTGDRVCTDCQTIIGEGQQLPLVHKDGDRDFICDECGATIEKPTEPTKPTNPPIEQPTVPVVPPVADSSASGLGFLLGGGFVIAAIALVAVLLIAVIIVVIVISVRKKKKK